MTEPIQASKSASSPWSPLRSRAFAVLWTAAIIGNIGVSVRDIGSAWLMTDLSPSPAMVALVQAAGSLPIFMFAIPAGALSDLFDRKKLMLVTQGLLMIAILVMAIVTALGGMTPQLLLAFTFIGGVGAAVTSPVWQSLIPELVDRTQLKGAVALNSLGLNVSRAIGPALGGAIIISIGVAGAFFTDALSYLVVLAALVWWKRPEKVAALPPEHLIPAMLAALRYARSSAELKRVLVRAFLLFWFASAPWALLPLIVRHDLNGTAAFYGLMLGGIGGGAVAGALVLPRVRNILTTDRLVLLGTSLLSVAGVGLAAASVKEIAWLMTPILGFGWITIITCLNITAQSILPNWFRGRGLAIYLTTFFGAMTFGSVAWGQIAQFTSSQVSLTIAAIMGLLVGLACLRFPLPRGEQDLTPSMHWLDPVTSADPGFDAGPVMIIIEYEVRRENKERFKEIIHTLSASRRRDGAYAWGMFADVERPERLVEYFLVESWAEHLRQHQRVSHADAILQSQLRALHSGDGPPKVSHLIASRT